MKANVFLTIIGAVVGCLIGYLAYYVAEGDQNDMVCGIGSAICFIATLCPLIGWQFESGKLGTNIRMMTLIFFVVFLISNFCFAGFGVNMPLYVIVNGVLLLIYLAIFYKMQGINNI